jgi:ribosomal protein S30
MIRVILTTLLLALLLGGSPVLAQTQPSTPRVTVTQRQALTPRTQKKRSWLKRVLNATWRYPLAAGLRLTLLNDAGNFYEDGGTYPR